MDTQIVELIGRHHLTAELLRAGLEVATPVRDRGIDIIAYSDINVRQTKFAACPIQMKASMKRSFGLNTKYERIHNLLIAYVWNLEGPHDRVIYAMTYLEALSIATKLDWTKTSSWKETGAYVNTKPSDKIISFLEPYRMTPEKWLSKVVTLMEYEERENQKEKGWDLYANGVVLTKRATGLFMVIESHFHRNPEAPSITIYAAHWLWANQHRFDRVIVDLLKARYPLPDRPQIQQGYSDWNSYGDPNYKIST